MAHLLQRRGDQAAEADDVNVLAAGRLQNLVRRGHDAQVDDLVVVAAQDDADDVLADVVNVTLDRGQQDAPGRAAVAALGLFRLDVGHEVGHGLLHDAGALDHLRQEHLARAEQIADDVHAVHQRPLNDAQRPLGRLSRLFHVCLDVGVDALHQGMGQPLIDRQRPPGQVFVLLFGSALDRIGEGDEAFGGVGPAVEQHVLDPLQQIFGQVFVDGQLPGVDDTHVHAGADAVIEEGGVHGLAHGVVAAEGEADVAEAAADEHAGQLGLDAPGGLEVGQGVLVVLLNARADGEDVGVEDDVLRREADLPGQQVVGAVGNGDALIDRLGLAVLVEGHDDDRRAITPGQPRLAQEFGLALLQADGVDDALALDALQPGLDDAPLGRVEHDRHAGNVGFAGDEVQKAGHGRLGVEHALVHVDVDHLCAVFHLLAGHVEGGAVVAGQDELGEAARAGDVGALADVDEVRLRGDDQRLQAAEAGVGRQAGDGARRQVAHGLGKGADVGRRRAAATADDVEQSFGGVVAQHAGHVLRRVVVLAKLVGQPGVGVDVGVGVNDARQGVNVVAEGRRAQRAIQAGDERLGVHDRGIDGLGRLAGQVATAGVDDGAGDHQRSLQAHLVQHALHAEDSCLGVQRVEDSLDEQDVGPAIDQAARRLAVTIGQLVESDIAVGRVVDVGREGGRAVGGAKRSGDKARPRRVAPLYFVARFHGQSRRGQVHLVGQPLHAVVALSDAVGVEGIGLDQVGPGFKVGRVDGANDVGLGQRQQVVVALQVAGPVGEALAAEVGLAQAVLLDHRAHGPVEDEDTPGQLFLERLCSVHIGE